MFAKRGCKWFGNPLHPLGEGGTCLSGSHHFDFSWFVCRLLRIYAQALRISSPYDFQFDTARSRVYRACDRFSMFFSSMFFSSIALCKGSTVRCYQCQNLFSFKRLVTVPTYLKGEYSTVS